MKIAHGSPPRPCVVVVVVVVVLCRSLAVPSATNAMRHCAATLCDTVRLRLRPRQSFYFLDCQRSRDTRHESGESQVTRSLDSYFHFHFHFALALIAHFFVPFVFCVLWFLERSANANAAHRSAASRQQQYRLALELSRRWLPAKRSIKAAAKRAKRVEFCGFSAVCTS